MFGSRSFLFASQISVLRDLFSVIEDLYRFDLFIYVLCFKFCCYYLLLPSEGLTESLINVGVNCLSGMLFGMPHVI